MVQVEDVIILHRSIRENLLSLDMDDCNYATSTSMSSSDMDEELLLVFSLIICVMLRITNNFLRGTQLVKGCKNQTIELFFSCLLQVRSANMNETRMHML
jgi:hypothetical protein